MSNIHGLGSRKVEKKADEEEYTQGAAGQSGTAVWRPNDSASRNPGGPINPASAAPGMPMDPIAALLGQARANANAGAGSGAEDRNIGLITCYANGFVIGSGEFRDSKEAKNKQFIEDLKKGDVPEELEEICRKEWGTDIDSVRVQLVDKSSETFTPPKPKFDFAKSAGQSLGGAASSAASTAATFATAAPAKLVVDASQPTTTLQIVLADKKRVKETANQSATVMQLYQHIMSLTGMSGFELIAGFPPKPLSNPALTLKEAGLLNGSITQRG